jgi:hypothetical protein
MTGPRSRRLAATIKVTSIVALVLLLYGAPKAGPSTTSQRQDAVSSAKGRIYIFRIVRSFGAHLDDTVVINGAAIHRLGAGNGIYCDVPPGDYTVGLSQHKARPLKVSVAAGQQQYICVMLHARSSVTPRSGALSSDQSFDIRLLNPDYGTQRIREYHLTKADCQP